MLFWFRILLVLLRSWTWPRKALLDESRLELRVWIHESEVSFANQAIYAHYLELGRWAWGMQAGIFTETFKQRILTILGGQLLRYRRPLRRFQKFTVRTRVAGWDDKWVYLDQSIWVGEELAHSALVKFCCRSRREIVPPSRIFGAEPPALSLAVMKWQEAEKTLKTGLTH